MNALTTLAAADLTSVSGWDILRLPLLEAILVGALGGLVGCLAVLHQRIFFTESVTHATFPGAVLGVVCAVPLVTGLGTVERHTVLSLCLFAGAAIMCIPMAWLMHQLARIPGQSSQAAAGIVLTLGFALGYFLVKWFQPLPLRIESFLTGSVLNVQAADVIAAAVILLIAIAITAAEGRKLVFYAFDQSGFQAVGLSGARADCGHHCGAHSRRRHYSPRGTCGRPRGRVGPPYEILAESLRRGATHRRRHRTAGCGGERVVRIVPRRHDRRHGRHFLPHHDGGET